MASSPENLTHNPGVPQTTTGERGYSYPQQLPKTTRVPGFPIAALFLSLGAPEDTLKGATGVRCHSVVAADKMSALRPKSKVEIQKSKMPLSPPHIDTPVTHCYLAPS
jgi:hypothetical protein